MYVISALPDRDRYVQATTALDAEPDLALILHDGHGGGGELHHGMSAALAVVHVAGDRVLCGAFTLWELDALIHLRHNADTS